MDYINKLNLADGTELKRNTFYLTDDNVAKNNQDYGNYLWGAAMNTIGFTKHFTSFAANVYSLIFTNIDNKGNPDYEKVNFYQIKKRLDSEADQRAIKSGWETQKKVENNE
jgi:hypothetical protein